MKRFTPLVLSFLALLFLGAGCFTTTVNVNTNGSVKGATTNTAAASLITVPVVLDTGSTTTTYSVQVAPETTALALLEKAASEQHFTIDTKSYSFGMMINGINDLKADDQHFWSFLVNDKQATVGAGDYHVQQGDRIKFKYEKLS